MDYIAILSKEFSLRPEQVKSAIQLIDDGNTIPFIARYRKEATGSMDDQVLRELAERLAYLRGLDKRRAEIEKSLLEQGVMTDEIAQSLKNAATLSALEDIYRPFRPKRRTRATVARERGLEPLALLIMAQQPRLPKPLAELAADYVNDGVPDAEAALSGARDIIAESVSDDAVSRGKLRDFVRRAGILVSVKAKEGDSVYAQYADYKEPISRIPPHRVLAVNRGEKEEFLRVSVSVEDAPAVRLLENAFVKPGMPSSEQVSLAVADAWERLIFPSLEREMRAELSEKAEESAVRVFSDNLHQLLMQPPIKGKVTLGVDPGFRTGCKLAVIDENGRVLDTGVGHFTIPGQTMQREQAKKIILNFVEKYKITAIAIGNGTASRESEQFIVSLLPDMPRGVAYMIVSEAGASVYSASKLGAEEFPEFDVSLRSAVSIARRMQDPLAELVKIDPKAIGVGQYQHDVKEARLNEALSGVVESCVNQVGVEVSTASPSLLSFVAGVGPSLAKNIVAYRDENGIKSRTDLKKVPKLGPRAFEQCAGFLRVAGAKNVLDTTGVHPESYAAAEKLLAILDFTRDDVRAGNLATLRLKAEQLGLAELAKRLDIGVPTLNDIISELMKPGRDPRDELPKPVLRTDVLDMSDLTPGMELTGTVRNVIDFGAFVDIGVHQDGLVHISRMAGRFIKHPSEVVKVGDVVKVWVVDVDQQKKRIALTMLPPKQG